MRRPEVPSFWPSIGLVSTRETLNTIAERMRVRERERERERETLSGKDWRWRQKWKSINI